MADTLLPAEPGTKALKLHWEGDTPWADMHPVIGWAYVSGGMAHPVTAANITDARAVLFPSGEVTDRQLRTTFESLDSWLAEMQDLGPGRAVVPHRSGGGETYDPEDPTPSTGDEQEVAHDLSDAYEAPAEAPEPESKSIADLGLSSRARNALEAFGVFYVRGFGEYQKDLIKTIRGVPTNAMPVIEAAMKAEGVRWYDGSRPSETAAPSDDDNDDLL